MSRVVRVSSTGVVLALACGCAAGQSEGIAAVDPLAYWRAEQGFAVPPPAAEPIAAEATVPFERPVRDQGNELVLGAMAFLGMPYRRGGDGEQGFDCSGFTRHVFERALGVLLPRRADEQAHAAGLILIRRADLRPGDLVFFNTLRRTFSHVGIYIGEGKFIHAPRPGGDVRIEDMHFAYWAKRFTGARRASDLADAGGRAIP